MDKVRPHPLVRLLPSLTDVAFLMPAVFLFARLDGGRFLLGDGDTGWHVRAGEWMLANGRVPDRDLFSFTKAGEPWYAWEWLWDVIFGWLHTQGGLTLVVLGSLLVLSFTSALLYRLVRRACGNVLLAAAVTFLAVAASAIHWLARPHLFTMLFVVIFCSLLERVREGRTKLLWCLPPLTALWANLHGGFLAGLLLLGAYAVGELAGAACVAENEERHAALRRGGRYALAAAGCLAASFLNPYFYRLHLHMYRYLTEPYHFDHIEEFQSMSFHHPVAVYFEALLLLGCVAIFWSLRRRRFTHAVMLAGWAHLALYSARNVPIFAAASAPVIALTLVELGANLREAAVAGWLKRLTAAGAALARDIGAIDQIGRVYATSGAAFLLLAAMFYVPDPPAKFRAEYDPKSYPAKAVEALAQYGASQRIFADDEWGDYLIYRLYPKTKVFVDGRSDFYGPDFSKRYLETLTAKYDWQQELDRHGIETVLLPVKAPLASTLKESKSWQPVYDDGVAIAFRSRAAAELSGVRRQREPVSAAPEGSGISGGRQVTKTQLHPEMRREPL